MFGIFVFPVVGERNLEGFHKGAYRALSRGIYRNNAKESGNYYWVLGVM